MDWQATITIKKSVEEIEKYSISTANLFKLLEMVADNIVEEDVLEIHIFRKEI